LRHHIENIGKRALEQSGKYRVNKNDEESLRGTYILRGSGVPRDGVGEGVCIALAPPAMSVIALTRG
jgi:hypothetical protein